ncbi:glycoside hydrolase family 5 protein [Pyrococcus kukulkanii]|uniref:glycoside hydrolase family 5 protein n=1 Tax=Pyrococcus kukulkanii TaxID=1609559 RepID=UPI00356579D5
MKFLTFLLMLSVFLALLSPVLASSVYYEAIDGNIYKVNMTTGERERIYLFGVSWFGFELKDHIVYGLNVRNWKDILKDVKRLGFNAIRLPFCSETIHGAMPNPNMINYDLNPDLRNLTGLEIMEKIIQEANRLGIYVLLDYHRIGCTEIEPLWYTDNYSEEQYIQDWVFLAKKFGRYPNVIGADIKNEPHDEASWGTGDNTDFRLFAERVGKAILKVAPHWLIFVEGTQYTHVPEIDRVMKEKGWWTFWGENLMGVKYYPIRLPRDKVVYSPHVYGPSVYNMPYFDSPDFPKNMPQIWETHFGYLTSLNYTLVIGEWGGKYTGKDKVWQDAFSDWLIKKGIYNFFYWCLNPESGDTGGIFLDDWKTVNWEKMRVIYRIIKAARPNFNEPLFIILKKNTSGQVFDKGEKVTIYWYTNGEIIDSNFAKSNEGEIILTLNESINLYIVAKKGNETMRKDLYLSVIEPNTPITTTSRPTISERNPKIFTMLLVSLGILSFVVFLVLKKKLV